MFHKEGFFIIVFTFLFTAGIAIGSDYFISIEWLKLAIQIIALGFLIIVLQFFRNPKRNTTLNPDHIIAPVDGKVVVIEEVLEKEYFKDQWLVVSIFMSPINVHVTRYAMS